MTPYNQTPHLLQVVFYQIVFNGDVYGLKNRFVMLFGTLSSVKCVLEWKCVATDLF